MARIRGSSSCKSFLKVKYVSDVFRSIIFSCSCFSLFAKYRFQNLINLLRDKVSSHIRLNRDRSTPYLPRDEILGNIKHSAASKPYTMHRKPYPWHIRVAFEFFHIKLSSTSLNLMTRRLQSKGIDPRISSAEGHIRLWSQVL